MTDLHIEDVPGDGPAFVLAHGYPDDSRIYRRLVPELAPRRVVTFDFLGHGRSSREFSLPLRREDEVGAVLDRLDLDRPILVGHDSSGPVVIQYALAHPDRVGGLVLLNTYYGDSPTLRFPELIRLFADPHFAPLADAIVADQQTLAWMLGYTDTMLREGPADPHGVGVTSIVPQFFGAADQPTALPAIRAWTAGLFSDLSVQASLLDQLSTLDMPVTLAFGAHDPCFNPGVAEHLRSLFAKATRHEIADASHWPQWDQPGATAAVLLGHV